MFLRIVEISSQQPCLALRLRPNLEIATSFFFFFLKPQHQTSFSCSSYISSCPLGIRDDYKMLSKNKPPYKSALIVICRGFKRFILYLSTCLPVNILLISIRKCCTSNHNLCLKPLGRVSPGQETFGVLT